MADTILLLYRDDYYAERENRESNKPNVLEVFAAKNRDGEIGTLDFYINLDTQFVGELFNN